MLVKLRPDQVAEQWDFIWRAIEGALPPMVENKEEIKTTTLRSILIQELEVWVYITYGEETDYIHAVITTMIQGEPVFGNRDFLIYTMYGIGPVTDEMWHKGFITLLKYAKGLGCDKISAYTKNQRVKSFLHKLGAESYTYMTLKLPKGGDK